MLWGHPEYVQGRESPLGQALQHKGIHEACHLMHIEENRWLWVEKVRDRFELPNTHYVMIVQALSF